MRIYATLGPACADLQTVSKMLQNGVTGFRLNLSHGDVEDFLPWLEIMHQASANTGIFTELLLDLHGPELRIGKLPNPLHLKEGQVICLGLEIPCPDILLNNLRVGQRVIFDDGKLVCKVTACAPGSVFCQVVQPGILGSRKSVYVPGLELCQPTLSREDIHALHLAEKIGATGVMLPFVRSRRDVLDLRQTMERFGAQKLAVLAKVECLAGVQHLGEYIDLVDEVVIARGDLGTEIPLWQIPWYQEKIGQFCLSRAVPFMVVTQMLESMVENPTPTRPEMTDIYTAVMQGASSLMLTQETAIGKYPLEAVRYLRCASQEAQKILFQKVLGQERPSPIIDAQ